MNLEEIYANYTKINIRKIYYKEKYYKVYIAIFLFFSGMLLIPTMALIPNRLSLLKLMIFICAITFVTSGLYLIKKVDAEMSRNIKKKLDIKYEYKSIYSYFSFAKSREFINYLNEIGIKSYKQKEILAKLLYEKYNETKVNDIWVIGVLVALILPVWNKIIDVVLSKHMSTEVELIDYIGMICITIIVILILVGFFRITIYSNIIDSVNTKSKRYKSMYDLLQIDILNNKNFQEYNGEITLSKKI